MKLEDIRQTIIHLMAFLMPFTLFYFLPVSLVAVAEEGIIGVTTVVYLIFFIISLFAGRIWCSYICPCGGLQEILGSTSPIKISGRYLGYIKYLVFVFLLGSVISSYYIAGGVKGIDLLYGTSDAPFYPSMISVYFVLVVVMFILSFTLGKRSFCRFICPMCVVMIIGRKISNLIRLPALHLHAVPENCVSCGRCNEVCQMSLPVSDAVKTGDLENSNCILCGACAGACRKNAISLKFKR